MSNCEQKQINSSTSSLIIIRHAAQKCVFFQFKSDVTGSAYKPVYLIIQKLIL